jgi:hypothetical protein
MTWRELNDQLRKAKDVKVILQLYKAERKGKHRKMCDEDLLPLLLSLPKERNEGSGVSRIIRLMTRARSYDG